MIIGNKVKLRDKKLSDARKDYIWQTDPELIKLDAAPLVTISFSQYLLDYTIQLRQSTSTKRLFAVETVDGEHIGNCTYYGIDESKGEAEVGIMIGDRSYWDNGYGTDVVVALASHIFLHTNLKRIHLKTLDWNKRAQKCFEKSGFTPYSSLSRDGYKFVLMEIQRDRWAEQRRRLKRISARRSSGQTGGGVEKDT